MLPEDKNPEGKKLAARITYGIASHGARAEQARVLLELGPVIACAFARHPVASKKPPPPLFGREIPPSML